MTILSFDTSSADLSVCVCAGGAEGRSCVPVSSVSRHVKNSHAEHIALATQTALALGGLTADDITHVALSTGPGSFTGLRIGVSFVKGFCTMSARKVLPLSSLMILAHAAGFRERAQKIYAALDARQNLIHFGGFVWEADKKLPRLRRLRDDTLSDPKNLLGILTADDLLITDTMGYSRSTVFEMFAGSGAQIMPVENMCLNRAHSCAALAFENMNDEKLWQDADAVVPNYLQSPAAVAADKKENQL